MTRNYHEECLLIFAAFAVYSMFADPRAMIPDYFIVGVFSVVVLAYWIVRTVLRHRHRKGGGT